VAAAWTLEALRRRVRVERIKKCISGSVVIGRLALIRLARLVRMERK
jgi:hypothetical protein